MVEQSSGGGRREGKKVKVVEGISLSANLLSSRMTHSLSSASISLTNNTSAPITSSARGTIH